jgi:Ca2+-binding RTX toxin-like protein
VPTRCDDYLLAEAGDDVLDDGPGRDDLRGGVGTDTLLARDGAADGVDCSGDNPQRLTGDRATIDSADEDFWCDHVSGARRLVVHGLVHRGRHALALIVSCPTPRVCGGRVEIHGVWRRQHVHASRALRISSGRRVRVPIRLNRRVTAANYDFDATVVTRAGRKLRVSLLSRHL